MIVERLAALLAKATASLEQEPVTPTKLRALNVQLDEMHGQGLDVGEGLLAATLRKLSTEGVDSFDAGDDLVMCNGFMQQHALLEGKSPCMLASVREPLLRRWKAKLQDDVLGMLLWRAVCMAYFLVEERDAADSLRLLLKAGRDHMQRLDRKPGWLVFFLAHAELFDDRPGRALANQWFAGEDTLAECIREHAELPDSSWLWEEMVAEILRKVEMLTETAFVAHVRNLLQLSRQYMRQRDRIYAVMIEKYAGFASKDVPAPLIEAVIDAWGNPQMERVDAAHRWSNVSEKTRIWMCQLLAEKDLADFFELISKGSKAGLSAMDTRRMIFWKRYTQHMTYTRLVLGDGFHNSRNGSIRTFVENRKKRLGLLVSDPENAAFLMRIGDYWFVEFSQTGNAFYSYAQGGEPFDPYARSIRTASMKQRPQADEWIVHNGSWEDKLGDYVERVIRGKRPRSIQAGRSKVLEPISKEVLSKSPSQPLLKKSFESKGLSLKGVLPCLSSVNRKELCYLLKREVDYGGRLGYWIELIDSPSIYLIREMKKQGFNYKHGRGFYQ